MKKWPLIIIMAAIVGLILAFIIGQILPNMRTSSSDIEVNITDPALIKQGEYVARTADCCLSYHVRWRDLCRWPAYADTTGCDLFNQHYP